MTMPDRAPDQSDPQTGTEPRTSLESEGWGAAEPPNPFAGEQAATPWFRRPAPLIGGAMVAVVVIVGLVVALVVTVNGGDSSDSAAASTTTTSSSATADDELTYADREFLRGISPLIKRNATDEELLDQADFVCSKLESSSKSEIQTALIVTATQVAAWKGEPAPTHEGTSYSFPEELATDAMRFMLDAEGAFCPGAFPDTASDMLS